MIEKGVLNVVFRSLIRVLIVTFSDCWLAKKAKVAAALEYENMQGHVKHRLHVCAGGVEHNGAGSAAQEAPLPNGV